MANTNTVGRGNYGTQGPTPTANPTPSTAQTSANKLFAEIDGQLFQVIGQPLNVGTSGQVSPKANLGLLNSLSSDQLKTLASILKKMGYSVKGNVGSVRALFQTEPELEQLVTNVITKNGTGSTLISDLNNMYIPIGTETGPTLPSRTITEQDPVILGKIADAVYVKELGRVATDAEKKAAIEKAQGLIQEGTLTTTEKVKNPKTGKMENVTRVKSAFSQSSFEENLAEGLKSVNPDDYDRQKRIEFNSWLSGIQSGGQV